MQIVIEINCLETQKYDGSSSLFSTLFIDSRGNGVKFAIRTWELLKWFIN